MVDKINGRTAEEIKGLLANRRCFRIDTESILDDALAYIRRLERELDAAVQELRRTHNCNICKHHERSGGDCEGWSVCGYNIPKWEWRGVEVE